MKNLIFKNSVLICLVVFFIPDLILSQEESKSSQNKFYLSSEFNYSSASLYDEQTKMKGQFGIVGNWKITNLKNKRRSDIGIVVPIRNFQTSSKEEILDADKLGYSAAVLFRLNTQWNIKKEHTYFYLGLGPEIRNSIRVDNNDLIPMLQTEVGFKIDNPDLLFPNTEIGFYASLPVSNPHFKDRLRFTGAYLRIKVF